MDAVARRIEGQGTLQSEWETCSWLHALPERGAAAVLQDVRRLVVVSPHPDDEVLGCAGIMQAALADDVAVHVVSVTDGEACYPDQPLWPPARLRDARRRELASALRALGLDATHVMPLGLPDGGVVLREADLQAQLSSQLLAGDLLLAPWIHDGHPDHEAAGRAAQAAAQQRGATVLQYPVWAWHWLDPAGSSSPWAVAARIPMVAAALERKKAAIQAFATQRGEVDGLSCEPILPDPVTDRFHRSYEVLIG